MHSDRQPGTWDSIKPQGNVQADMGIPKRTVSPGRKQYATPLWAWEHSEINGNKKAESDAIRIIYTSYCRDYSDQNYGTKTNMKIDPI